MKKRFQRWVGLKLATMVRNAGAELDRQQSPGFSNSPERLLIESPSRIINGSHITMGDDVALGPGCMLNAIRQYPGRFLSNLPDGTEIQKFDPSIRIGDRVSATGFLSISAVDSVTIEDDVIFASHIFISDHSHGRARTDIPYKYQPLANISPVVVGKGCWIGEHAVLMPGVSIGEFSIVGANSVVSSDVPERSIVAGAPARVVKVWSESESEWVSPA